MDDLKNLIEGKDIDELKKKKKKFKFSVKRTLLGVLCTTFVISNIPNIEYNIARMHANNSQYITSVLENSNLSKQEQITQIYKTALNENKNIPDDIKELFIKAFTSEIIDYTGVFFTENTIRNMYAVTKTERVKEMSEFSKEHGWWSGDYNSYFNLINVESYESDTLLAHEQLHAILKAGYFGSGLTTGVEGYGINEGVTSFFGKSDYSYLFEHNTVTLLGLIIGYEDFLTTYTNSDLSALKKLLCQYLSPKEANELINKLDLLVFSGYFETFLVRNNINYDTNKMLQKKLNNQKRIRELIKNIFKAKYGIDMKESKLGNLIMNSTAFLTDDQIDLDSILYNISFNNKDSVRLTFTKCDFSNGLAKIIIKSKGDVLNYYNDENLKNEIAKAIGVDKVYISSCSKIDDNHISITISDIEYAVDIDKLENFDCDKEYKKVCARVELYNAIQLESHQVVKKH